MNSIPNTDSLNISVSFCSAKVGANPAADVTSLSCKPVITLTSPLLLTDRNLGFALAPLRETTWVNGTALGCHCWPAFEGKRLHFGIRFTGSFDSPCSANGLQTGELAPLALNAALPGPVAGLVAAHRRHAPS
jgi:hypothetical protein